MYIGIEYFFVIECVYIPAEVKMHPILNHLALIPWIKCYIQRIFLQNVIYNT